jgi:hypothetical protein
MTFHCIMKFLILLYDQDSLPKVFVYKAFTGIQLCSFTKQLLNVFFKFIFISVNHGVVVVPIQRPGLNRNRGLDQEHHPQQ